MQNAILFPIWLLNLTFFNIGSTVKYYLSPTEHHSACLNNGCAFLAVRDMKAVIILFVCHLQMSLSIKCTHWSKNVPCCSHAFFNSSCKRHNHCCSQGTLSAQSRSLCAFSSALSVPRWCVWLLNRSRFNHTREWDQAHEMQPSVLYS